jgi:hypothetical protein
MVPFDPPPALSAIDAMHTPSAITFMTFRRIRIAAALGLLGAQLVAIAYARFAETRYFAWAPYDQVSEYEIHAVVDGATLSDSAIRDRYRLPAQGRNNHSIAHIKGHLRCYEQTYGKGTPVEIRLTYSLNGTARQTWTWRR